ncbi:MAG TPA: FAD-dependent oxidoreductase [Thermomicrobiales bacterium]|nr:FAD-dependent oxidoreductase [Thermomicrobiales bacterium]
MIGSGLFDVVIVGAGPAGCVLANRLTEDNGRTVALLEAGPDYGADPAAWPAVTRDSENIYPDSHSWGYLHANRTTDRPLPLPRARVVGGSSTINACVWVRGSAADYDGWAALGNPGWSFAELLPYFRRAEADPMGGPFHGTDGPVPVFREAAENLSQLDQAFVSAAEALGFPWVADLNGDALQHAGVGPTPRNVADGGRMHAALTYLAPARPRANLTIVPDALVDRVLIEDGRATGVRTADGREIRGRQVVLSAGAYGSPAILLRSGVGPAADLRELGIAVVADRPGVGAHLLDHPGVIFANGDDIAAYSINPASAPTADTGIATLVKARSHEAAEDVDLYIIHVQLFDEALGRWVAVFVLNLEVAPSHGRVRLTASDPTATLDIDHAYLSEPAELEACCDGVELIAQLVNTRPLADVLDPLPGRVPHWRDREELRAMVRDQVSTVFHPSGTCRMGPATDFEAVVDHAGRVYGVAGLRVADASIFPTIPRANIHCTVVAVAEKLADDIRRDATA